MSASNDAAAISKQIDYLTRALKAPRIREAATRLGDPARDAGWTHEEYLAGHCCVERSRAPGAASLPVRADDDRPKPRQYDPSQSDRATA